MPVAPWSGGPVDDLAAAAAHAETIGYPLMVKATAGGGGRGIRLVDRPEELAAAFESARAEGAEGVRRPHRLHGARGRATPATSRCRSSPTPRHRLGARRARLQRAAAQPEGDRGVALRRPRRRAGRELLRAAAVRLAARRATPTPAPSSSCTSRESGVRLPRGQHPAAGRAPGHRADHRSRPRQAAAARRRRAAGWRTSPAAARSATPSRPGSTPRTPSAASPRRPGGSSILVLPVGPGIRVDTGVAEGDVIPPEFDSMIAKVIAWGRDRDEALRPAAPGARRDRRSSSTAARRTRSFLLDLLDRPEVRAGESTPAGSTGSPPPTGSGRRAG